MMAAASGLPVLLALFLGAPWRLLGAAQQPPPQDAEFTFLLPAGRRECFYQAALINGSMELEYQVRVACQPGDDETRPGRPGAFGQGQPLVLPGPAASCSAANSTRRRGCPFAITGR